MFVIWAPILQSDNRSTALLASGYLPDPRAQHLWDPWSFAMRHYTDVFRYPRGEMAWDIFILYQPDVVWKDRTPDPVMWMQHRNLDVGDKFNPAQLEAELLKWVR